MTKSERKELKQLKSALKAENGFIMFEKDIGETTVYMPVLTHYAKKAQWFFMSKSYCSPNDTFKKKVGQIIALRRMFHGERIRVNLFSNH